MNVGWSLGGEPVPTDFTVTINPAVLKWRVDPPRVDGRPTMPAQMSTLSSEYVTVLVAAREAGADVNLASGATVRLAFKAEGEDPEVADWNAGTWDTDTTYTPTRYYARILVGPDGEVLTAGTYVVWVEITDSPETVVRPAGYLVVS